LKQLIERNTSLPEALQIIREALALIRNVERYLPDSPDVSFRERLIARMEQESVHPDFRLKADAVLLFFDRYFGVNDFFDTRAGGHPER
jgi:hypothetical protein